MGQLIAKVLGGIGGVAVVFYAIGFVAVQSYVYRNGFEGMFWLTNEFYRDAGAKFLLETVRAPLTAWYLVFPYVWLLYLLIPKGNELQVQPGRGRTMSHRQAVQTLALLGVMAMTYLIVLSYNEILGNWYVAQAIDFLFRDPTNAAGPEPKQGLAFFTLVVPVVVAGALYLHRFQDSLKRGAPSREAYGFFLIAYVVFLTVVPIGYGMHLYDWKTVPVKEPQMLGPSFQDAGSNPGTGGGSDVWLVGEFGNRYVFLRKNRATGERFIEAVTTSDIKRLPLDLTRSGSLKYDLSADTPALVNAYEDILKQSISAQGASGTGGNAQ